MEEYTKSLFFGFIMGAVFVGLIWILSSVFKEDDTENNHKPFWSNCLIQAVKHHWKDPENVDYIVIDRAKGFHVMWIDKRERKIKHFTHRRLNGKFSSLWFKGTIENVEYDALKEWCEKNHVKFNVERP